MSWLLSGMRIRVSKTDFARSFALFFGLFTVANLLTVSKGPALDPNLWLLDLRFLPGGLRIAAFLFATIILLLFAVSPPVTIWRCRVTGVSAVLLAAVGIANGLTFYSLLADGIIRSRLPIPFSAMLAGGFALVAVCCFRKDARTEMTRPDNRSRWISLAPTLAGTALLAVLFPVLQTVCFGKTDYTRNAQVAVVFGARAYANGQPSDALADRVRTACDLYRQGRVQTLVMSGGPGDGPIHETEAMRRMAIAEGVNDQDIILDTDGLNTLKTVDNTVKLFPELGARRILVVSHFYHLPRIKMAYHQKGWEVYTVPAKERYFLRQTPYSVAREVAAFWSYYLKSFRV
jgi:vancomycin permeability regulator SanA